MESNSVCNQQTKSNDREAGVQFVTQEYFQKEKTLKFYYKWEL